MIDPLDQMLSALPGDNTIDKVIALLRELQTAHVEIAKLRQALAPFAQISPAYLGQPATEPVVIRAVARVHHSVTAGDFVRAQDAMQSTNADLLAVFDMLVGLFDHVRLAIGGEALINGAALRDRIAADIDAISDILAQRGFPFAPRKV